MDSNRMSPSKQRKDEVGSAYLARIKFLAESTTKFEDAVILVRKMGNRECPNEILSMFNEYN